MHLLVLAGTGEARQLLTQLATNPNIRITASLAGATDRPAAFGVETRIGGFGGVEGLAKWCDGHAVDAIVDLTHPYAAQMSRHAAALSADLHVIAYARPAWQAAKNDRWTEFENWAAMAAALHAASGENVVAISAGNYGGKLGKHQFALQKLLDATPPQ